MKCIDFDRHFQKYTEEWVKKNRSRFKNIDEMEEQIPELYMRWLNQPQPFLDGKTPGAYFAGFENIGELISLLEAYCAQDVSVPDPLLERIVSFGEDAAGPLMDLVRENKDHALTVTAMNLLIEIGTEAPLQLCVDMIAAAREQDELTDVAAELLSNIGHTAVEPILARMDDISGPAQDAFLDVLCNFPGDERIYDYITQAFRSRYDKKALYASYLGKLGDERAIDILKTALDSIDINYLDYIEIVHAIEALGGEVDDKRDFSGDPYFESLRKMQ